MLDTSQLLILAAVAALGYVAYHGSRRDPREPPLVPSKVPLVGHLLGQVLYGIEYWSMQAKKHASHPIFALNMLFNKFYVVSSPELMQAVQRNNKSLSFEPLLDFSVSNIVGAHDKKILHLMQSPAAGGLGHARKILHALVPTLTGKSLDMMNSRMVKLMRPFIDELGGKSTFDLYKWGQDAITAASTDATYGPMNPYGDKEVADAFWEFEHGLGPLMANKLPWLTARKAWQGREKVAKAIYKYVQMGGQEQGSELTKVRFATTLESGVTHEEYAQFEVPMMIAFVSNTVPATFWTLFDLYSRPQLLEELRDEVKSNALSIATDGTHRIEIGALRENCPLLLSTFQEILRTRTTSSPSRVVTKDTLLADKYLLKAGSFVTMPSSQIGRRPEAWGETATEFDPRRFVKIGPSRSRGQLGEKEARRTGAFMTFGISPTICPGRHFACSEILGMVAMMMLRYDIVPVGGWVEPKELVNSMVSIMRPVKSEFPVNMEPRKEYEGAQWDFHVEEGKGQFPLAIG